MSELEIDQYSRIENIFQETITHLFDRDKLSSFCCINCCATNTKVLKCKCGQKPILELEWKWDESLLQAALLLGMENNEVFFHPTFEMGTTIARGNKPMVKNHLYYFEIKVLSPLRRRGLIIGVGLEDATGYVSNSEKPIGMNGKSWGFLCQGKLLHDSNRKEYGEEFGFGSIIGVYVNMIHGTVEYFLDRKSLGKAFNDLQDHTLYPMVSSSSNTLVRLTAAVEIQPSLQFLCSEVIRKDETLINQLEQIPALLKLYKKNSYWDLVPFEFLDDRILSVNNLSILTEIAFVEVFGYTNKCKCPKVIKDMLIHCSLLSDYYWRLLEITDTTKDHWMYNEHLLKSEGCTYRNLSKLTKFTKVIYEINSDKLSIIFDTNTSSSNTCFILHQCKKSEFNPGRKKSYIIKHTNLEHFGDYYRYSIKLSLVSCDCKRINASDNTSTDNNDFHTNMEIEEVDFMCHGNEKYSMDLALAKNRQASAKRKCVIC